MFFILPHNINFVTTNHACGNLWIYIEFIGYHFGDAHGLPFGGSTVATFQVVTQNRYKLNKKYRRLKEYAGVYNKEDDTGLLEAEGDQRHQQDNLNLARVG